MVDPITADSIDTRDIDTPDWLPIPGLRRALICGPVAEDGKPARGGFQSANLRVMSVLRRLGAEVGALRYPDRDAGSVGKALGYLLGFARIALSILTGSARGAVIHFTPYSKQFMPGEYALMLLARLRGYRVVMDLRAGSQRQIYQERGGALIRWSFGRAAGAAHALAFEGMIYDDFLAGFAPRTPRFWLPNFIPAAELHARQRFDPEGPNLIYVGLISEAKGALAVLALAHALRQTLPGTRLCFVGRIDAGFEPRLRAAGGFESWIEYTGAVTPDAVRARLDRAHFFVFFSLWRGEGHSNALTEAMARGCVPLVTRHGFLPDVVGTSGFVAGDRRHLEAAVAWIAAHWNAADWMAASEAAHRRVAENFTDLRVAGILRDIYSAALA